MSYCLYGLGGRLKVAGGGGGGGGDELTKQFEKMDVWLASKLRGEKSSEVTGILHKIN